MPPDALVKRFFAKIYGFTEEMTEESSLDAVTWWPEIESAQHYAEEKNARDAERRARSQMR